PDRFARAVAAIDAVNRDDPNVVEVRGRRGPKELLHAELVTEWVRRLAPDAGEPLLLAARGHHLRRWAIPRRSYPDGRAGYLRWRRTQHRAHARELGDILEAAGYDGATVERVQALVTKRNLDRDKMIEVVRKTVRKMSPEGVALVGEVDLAPGDRALLAAALDA